MWKLEPRPPHPLKIHTFLKVWKKSTFFFEGFPNLNGIISIFLQLGTITYCALIITFLTQRSITKPKIIWINIFEDIKTNFNASLSLEM